MKFRNNDPQGDLYIGGVGFVEAGAVFEADADRAEHFNSLPDMFPRVKTEKPAPQATEE